MTTHKKDNIVLLLIAVLLAVSVMILISGYNHPTETTEPQPASINIQDTTIRIDAIDGFKIREWPIASSDEPGAVYELKILIKGVGYVSGAVFDTRDEAEEVMIQLCMECGI